MPTPTASDMTCGKLIPLDIVLAALPSGVKLTGPFTQKFPDFPNDLICSYHSSDGSYLVGAGYNPDRTFDQAVAGVQSMLSNSVGAKCASSTIGSKSTECTYIMTAGNIVFSKTTDVIFITSNGKFDISVNAMTPGNGPDSIRVAEQVAKQINSNLSAH